MVYCQHASYIRCLLGRLMCLSRIIGCHVCGDNAACYVCRDNVSQLVSCCSLFQVAVLCNILG